MIRLGYDDNPQRNVKFDSRRKNFCKRLVLLHTKIAKRFRATSYCWDYRNNSTCVCGKLMADHWCERAFVHRDFTWPESYLHQIKYHSVAPPVDFYLMVLEVTKRFLVLDRLEKKTVNKHISA
jgi:hypothetical protein